VCVPQFDNHYGKLNTVTTWSDSNKTH